MMLVTSFAASIGGMATPVGTPPNLIGQGIPAAAGIHMSFAGWMAPWRADRHRHDGLRRVLARRARPPEASDWVTMPGVRCAKNLTKLGPVGAGERNVMLAFALTAALWVGPGLAQAMLGRVRPSFSGSERAAAGVDRRAGRRDAAVPASASTGRRAASRITWEEASHIDWGIILLFGGGLAMGQLADSTGLSAALGHWVSAQFPGVGTIGLTLVFTALAHRAFGGRVQHGSGQHHRADRDRRGHGGRRLAARARRWARRWARAWAS